MRKIPGSEKSRDEYDFFQHCNFVMRITNPSLEYFRWSMRMLYSGPNFARRRGLLENHRPIAISFTSCFLPYGASGRGEFWLRVTNIKPERPSMTSPLSYLVQLKQLYILVE